MATTRWIIRVMLMSGLALAAVAIVQGQGHVQGRAALEGYQEIPTLSTSGSGSARIRISPDESSIDYMLSYGDLEGMVTQSHIHLGRPAVNGGIIVWLCGSPGFAPPPPTPIPPPCPMPGGTVTGVLTAANVIGPGGQGIAAGNFARLVHALRSEATYVNVHTTKYPPGEIRGQVTFHAHGVPPR